MNKSCYYLIVIYCPMGNSHRYSQAVFPLSCMAWVAEQVCLAAQHESTYIATHTTQLRGNAALRVRLHEMLTVEQPNSTAQ